VKVAYIEDSAIPAASAAETSRIPSPHPGEVLVPEPGDLSRMPDHTVGRLVLRPAGC
jgi:hypothetical protein